ncbi:hypothetical protein HAX54_006544 [Datura stramonium]|uniref:HD-ZIP protein N-terminal domain-containing protein n=1 Tax=Datura stramonium TaxID=4076 RepID=A0ABS8RUU5_DATST|nr:hypothetical protein [Datura stramonium]
MQNILKGIDVNRIPTITNAEEEEEEDEETGISSPNSSISSLSGNKRSEREINYCEVDEENVLEGRGFKDTTLSILSKEAGFGKRDGTGLEQSGGLVSKQEGKTGQSWKQTEVDCEFLKRC